MRLLRPFSVTVTCSRERRRARSCSGCARPSAGPLGLPDWPGLKGVPRGRRRTTSVVSVRPPAAELSLSALVMVLCPFCRRGRRAPRCLRRRRLGLRESEASAAGAAGAAPSPLAGCGMRTSRVRSRTPSPSGRRWPEGPDEGPAANRCNRAQPRRPSSLGSPIDRQPAAESPHPSPPDQSPGSPDTFSRREKDAAAFSRLDDVRIPQPACGEGEGGIGSPFPGCASNVQKTPIALSAGHEKREKAANASWPGLSRPSTRFRRQIVSDTRPQILAGRDVSAVRRASQSWRSAAAWMAGTSPAMTTRGRRTPPAPGSPNR